MGGGVLVYEAMISIHYNLGSCSIVLPILDDIDSVSTLTGLATRDRRSRSSISIRRGSKTTELTLTWNPDKYQAQYPYRITTDLPVVLLPNTHHFHHLV